METRVVEGAIVILDLDRFGEEVEKRGLSEYSPNIATGTLTSLVEAFVSKWSAVVLYGLDHARGTEEAVIVVPGVDPWELEEDLVGIARAIEELGFSVSIVADRIPVVACKPLRERRLYEPHYRRVKRLLASVKRRGGGMVVIEGSVAYKIGGSRSG